MGDSVAAGASCGPLDSLAFAGRWKQTLLKRATLPGSGSNRLPTFGDLPFFRWGPEDPGWSLTMPDGRWMSSVGGLADRSGPFGTTVLPRTGIGKGTIRRSQGRCRREARPLNRRHPPFRAAPTALNQVVCSLRVVGTRVRPIKPPTAPRFRCLATACIPTGQTLAWRSARNPASPQPETRPSYARFGELRTHLMPVATT